MRFKVKEVEHVMPKMSKESAFELERRVMAYLESVREERGMPVTEWGRRAFGPEMTQAKMSFLVKGAARGEEEPRKPPKRITIADFVCLCLGLDLDPAAVFTRVYLDNVLPWSGELKQLRES